MSSGFWDEHHFTGRFSRGQETQGFGSPLQRHPFGDKSFVLPFRENSRTSAQGVGDGLAALFGAGRTAQVRGAQLLSAHDVFDGADDGCGGFGLAYVL